MAILSPLMYLPPQFVHAQPSLRTCYYTKQYCRLFLKIPTEGHTGLHKVSMVDDLTQISCLPKMFGKPFELGVSVQDTYVQMNKTIVISQCYQCR